MCTENFDLLDRTTLEAVVRAVHNNHKSDDDDDNMDVDVEGNNNRRSGREMLR